MWLLAFRLVNKEGPTQGSGKINDVVCVAASINYLNIYIYKKKKDKFIFLNVSLTNHNVMLFLTNNISHIYMTITYVIPQNIIKSNQNIYIKLITKYIKDFDLNSHFRLIYHTIYKHKEIIKVTFTIQLTNYIIYIFYTYYLHLNIIYTDIYSIFTIYLLYISLVMMKDKKNSSCVLFSFVAPCTKSQHLLGTTLKDSYYSFYNSLNGLSHIESLIFIIVCVTMFLFFVTFKGYKIVFLSRYFPNKNKTIFHLFCR